MTENTPAPSGRRPKRARHDVPVGYNPASMASIYRDLAVRFINNPQSNIIVVRMESLGSGRSRVMIELEIADVA
jgi:hypothetical protein